jgi:hypothetical protein
MPTSRMLPLLYCAKVTFMVTVPRRDRTTRPAAPHSGKFGRISSAKGAPRGRKHRLFVSLLTAAGLASTLAIAGGAGGWAGCFRGVRLDAVPQRDAVAHAVPGSYYELLALDQQQLEACDIGLMNLLCAKDVPGAEMLDMAAALTKLDAWAAKVKSETERHLYRARDPRYAEHYANSEARLRAEFIVQVLQEDCGVRFNPQRIRDVDFSNSRDLFIHGILASENGGTCASMPVLYAAIGRRLGYPMKLVAAKEHLFCRWDDRKERFNIEASGEGVSFPPDEHYHTWPHPISEHEVASGQYLTSMTAMDELAAFVFSRGCCWQHSGHLPEARAAFAEAHRLAPQCRNTLIALRGAVAAPFGQRRPHGARDTILDASLFDTNLPGPRPRMPAVPGPSTGPPRRPDEP